MFAVPFAVTCAVPSNDKSRQRAFTEVSQNSTCPGVTSDAPEATFAVSVITVPAGADVTALLPLVTVSVVDVLAAANARTPDENTIRNSKKQDMRFLRVKIESDDTRGGQRSSIIVACSCTAWVERVRQKKVRKTANEQADYTFAISVTTLPDAIVVAAPPPLVTVSDLEVA